MVDVGGYQMHILCQGQGSPTVVMDSAFGGFASDWSLVQPEIARFTRACAYDRAGYAWSEPNPGETVRTSRQLVRELHTLLEKDGIAGPYVLVGHSFGGLNVRLFADQYPDEVVGMVLLDPAHEDAETRLHVSNESIVSRFNFQADLLRIGPVRKWLAPRMMLSMIPEYKNLPPEVWAMEVAVALNSENLHTAAREAASATESMAQVRATRGLGDMPLIIMTSMAMPSSWMGLAKEMAGLSIQGRHVAVEGTGHYIQLGRPDAVIDAIRQVVEAARHKQTS
jgi:pimeloyl-ACP methyl ester carboxylesterase